MSQSQGTKYMKWVLIITTTPLMMACATTQRTLVVRSEPAEANVCIKGRENGFIAKEVQCVGKTPYESNEIEVKRKDGNTSTLNLADLEEGKQNFYVIVSKEGFSSQSVLVPGWDHYVALKPLQETVSQTQATEKKVIKINSQPTGALVYVNGSLRGNTPFAYEGDPGEIRVRIEHPDYDSIERAVQFTGESNQEIQFKLKEQEKIVQTKARIKIQSNPSGSLVFINGALKGNTPFIYEGQALETIAVKVEKPGFHSTEKSIKLGENQTEMSVDVQLKEEAHANQHASNEISK